MRSQFTQPSRVQRQATCTCGGTCPRCQADLPRLQRKAATASSSPAPSPSPAVSSVSCCQQAIGHVTFFLNNSGISTGYTCLRAGTPVRFRNFSQNTHTIDTRPNTLLTGMPTTIQPGALMVVFATQTPQPVSGSIYVSQTIHDITVCP